MEKILSRVVGVLLLICGAAKVASLFSGLPLLHAIDHVLNIPNWVIYLGGALLEIWVAIVLLWGKNTVIKTFSAAFLLILIASYRISWEILGRPTLCPCLGSVPIWLHLNQGVVSGFLISTYVLLQILLILMLQRYFSHGRSAKT